jgi:hypothetical protein
MMTLIPSPPANGSHIGPSLINFYGRPQPVLRISLGTAWDAIQTGAQAWLRATRQR